ncbi:MAG: RsmB/NOP family class I SAM-dependent RNA methyltransferase [Silicimonas sp.]|nr:RsmB/NOP family class I SAM-dependent RNA methyltransferase [Silicimonas sp.]
MTPAARIAAAIVILDHVLEGASVEGSLIAWARRSRFAGSGDRAAVRDLVFDAMRRQRSLAWLGGAMTGRGLMIGTLRAGGVDPAAMFTGAGYAPPLLSASEESACPTLDDAPEAVRLDCPDWLWPILKADHGDRAEAILDALRQRAPVFLRVNCSKTDRDEAIDRLAKDGIAARPEPLSATALIVEGHPRRIEASAAYRDGSVELQDAASQAVVDLLLPHVQTKRVLDFCAGGGGKSLHLAAGGAGEIVAHDADPDRMKDIPARAERSGHRIEITRHPVGPFDCVLADVPCSGSGAWRRQPEAKWRLTPERLSELNSIQDDILARAASLVGSGGILAYITCSLIRCENEARVECFLAGHDGWSEIVRRQFTPLDGGDGFFVAILSRN